MSAEGTNAAGPDLRAGWTGGQFSLLRAALAVASVVAALESVRPWLVLVALPLAVLVGVGFRHRGAAALLAGLLLLAETGGPGFPFALTVLLALHAFSAPAPYGSVPARGRVDPGGRWKEHVAVSLGATALLFVERLWILAEGTDFEGSGFGQAAFLLGLALVPGRVAWLVWAVVLPALATGWTVAGALAFAVVHLAAFRPRWIRPRRASAQEPELVFYDGTCGLCHGFVRFLLAEDANAAFRFATLQGDAFRERVPEEQRANVPDSVVALTADGRLLVRSSAVAHLLTGLGGLWRILGWLLVLIPRPLRDLGYDAVARVRHRLFAKPADACPMIPGHLVDRFLF